MGSTQSRTPKNKPKKKKDAATTTPQTKINKRKEHENGNNKQTTKPTGTSSHTSVNSSERGKQKVRGQDPINPSGAKVLGNGKEIIKQKNKQKHGSDRSKPKERKFDIVKADAKESNGEIMPRNHSKDTTNRDAENQEDERTKLKRLSQRKQKELVEKERKLQRVTKEQLRSLSCNLQKTSWYLGKSLGMNEGRIQKYESNYATEHEKKYQVLLWWRRNKGLKATVQHLVIALELARYEYNEYKPILTSSRSNGDVIIYDKPPDIKPADNDSNANRQLYHKDDYDKTEKGGHHYGNMNYNDILPSQIHRSSQSSSSTNRRRDRRQPRWRKPSENAASQSENEEERQQRAKEESDKDFEMPLPSQGIESLIDQSHASTEDLSDDHHDNNEIIVSDTSGSKQGNTLIVRRCSDSSMKLGYSSKFKDRMQAVKNADAPIKEHDSTVQSNNNDITKREDDNGDVIAESYKKDIRTMIAKYESLTRSNKSRENMHVQSKKTSTLPRNYKAPNYERNHPSSEITLGSHDINGNFERHSDVISDITLPRYRIFKFGGRGKFPSRFKGMISGLDVFPNGDIVTSDSDNRRIQIFNSAGKFRTTFDTKTELKPKGACVTPENNVAVCCGDQVHVYGRDGEKILSFGQGIFRNNCYSVCCDTMGNYYVTDIVSHTVSIHDNHGRIRKRFGFQGDGMINFNQPVSLSINSKNKLFITDSQNHCVKVYSLAGRPLFRIGSKGSTNNCFWNPLGLCIDHRDHLFVADCGNNRISEFDPIGNFVRHIATEIDELWMPSLVKVTNDRQVIVCEWDKQCIKVFRLETEV